MAGLGLRRRPIAGVARQAMLACWRHVARERQAADTRHDGRPHSARRGNSNQVRGRLYAGRLLMAGSSESDEANTRDFFKRGSC